MVRKWFGSGSEVVRGGSEEVVRKSFGSGSEVVQGFRGGSGVARKRLGSGWEVTCATLRACCQKAACFFTFAIRSHIFGPRQAKMA